MIYCCKDMEYLTQTVYFEIKDGKPYIIDQEWEINIGEEPIKYCPWCGSVLTITLPSNSKPE